MKTYKNNIVSLTITWLTFIVFMMFFSCEKTNYTYSTNAKSVLEGIISTECLASLNILDNSNHTLIDIRNPLEFEKGHLEGAMNIYAHDILNTDNFKLLNDKKSTNTMIILYGSHPNEAIAPFMLLYQLGVYNIKILSVENYYLKNELITKNVELERLSVDINAFIAESKRKAAEQAKQQIIQRPKKVIPVKKKKKIPVEGGC